MTKESLISILSKFTLYKNNRPNGNLIWINAVSIGEARSAQSLAREICKKNPDLNILFTTSTLSSYGLINREKKKFYLQYSPVDIDFVVKRFLKLWDPDLVIFFESEIWPNMVYNIHSREKKFIICNARISKNSYLNWKKIPSFYKTIFSKISLCLSQDKKSVIRLKELGVKSVKMSGNIKFLARTISVNKSDLQKFRIKLKGKNTITFFSSHPGEDEMFIRVAKRVKDKVVNCFFTLIPRHQNRKKRICKKLAQDNFIFSLRSEKKDFDTKTNFILVDTFGELGLFFKLSQIAIIGGSFVKKGGHNPIETKGLGCALIFGPNMQNFHHIAEKMIERNAGFKVKNEQELENKILFLLKNRKKITTASRNFDNLCNVEFSKGKDVVKEINSYLNNVFKNT